MTARNAQYMSQRQWSDRRRRELARLEALQSAARAAGVALQPSAPDGAVCSFCEGAIVDGICSTCDAVFIQGIRVPGKHNPLPFSDPREVTG